MATLMVDRNRTTCSACKTGAELAEVAHETRLDYGEHDGKGCGARFTSIMAVFSAPGFDERVAAMRPDLPLVQAAEMSSDG